MTADEQVTAAEPRLVAAFDFDGTMTRRDTLFGFLVAAGGARRTAAALGGRSLAMARSLRDDTRRDATKEAVVGRALRGRTRGELDAAGEQYAARLHSRLRPESLERIAWHRNQGHELVIVSASLVHYLRPIARDFGFADVIAVELEFDPETDRATGRLARANVRGPEKAARLREWLGARPATELWAYGNSSGDDELLAMADHATWIGKRAGRNA